MVTKKAPFAKPFNAPKSRSRVSVDETGQIAKVVTVFSTIAASSMFVAPALSQAMPDATRPRAMDALKQATTPAAVEPLRPIDEAI